jgi:hypothetical protein
MPLPRSKTVSPPAAPVLDPVVVAVAHRICAFANHTCDCRTRNGGADACVTAIQAAETAARIIRGEGQVVVTTNVRPRPKPRKARKR